MCIQLHFCTKVRHYTKVAGRLKQRQFLLLDCANLAYRLIAGTSKASIIHQLEIPQGDK